MSYIPGSGSPTSTTWLTTGAGVKRRESGGSSLLPSGDVLVTGGWSLGENSSIAWREAEIYRVATGLWENTVGLANVARAYHTQTLLGDGTVLLAGGQSVDLGASLATAETFDPATGLFTATANNMPNARCMHSASLLPSGKILIAGGASGGVAMATACIYDPATRQFTATGSMATGARYKHGAVSMPDSPNGWVFVCSGSGAGSTTTEVYQEGTGWLTDELMVTARVEPLVAVLPSGKVLVAGGWTGATFDPIITAEIHDPIAGSAVLVPVELTDFRGFGARVVTLPDGRILLVGGYTGGTGTNGRMSRTAEIFDESTGRFSRSLERPNGWSLGTAELLSTGRVLIAVGADVSLWYNKALLLVPSEIDDD